MKNIIVISGLEKIDSATLAEQMIILVSPKKNSF